MCQRLSFSGQSTCSFLCACTCLCVHVCMLCVCFVMCVQLCLPRKCVPSASVLRLRHWQYPVFAWRGPASDINECDQQGACHTAASCRNTFQSYECTCNSGFTGNGSSCEGRSSVEFNAQREGWLWNVVLIVWCVVHYSQWCLSFGERQDLCFSIWLAGARNSNALFLSLP